MKYKWKFVFANWNYSISLLCVSAMAKNGFGFQNIIFWLFGTLLGTSLQLKGGCIDKC